MRRWLTLAIVPALLLVALGTFMFRSQELARNSVADRFESRIDAGSNFIREFVLDRQALEERVALSRFADPAVDQAAFDLAIESLGFEAAVLLDATGHLLAVYPAKPSILGNEIGAKYRHLSAALTGTPAVSGVVPSAARQVPVVAIAVPYDTPQGRRVFSGAFSVEVGPLGNFLRDLLPFKGSSIYLVDAAGNIAASSEERHTEVVALSSDDPGLASAVIRDAGVVTARGRAELGNGSVRFVSVPIGGTTWHLASQVPESVLFEPLARNAFPQWLVLAGLAIAAGLAVYLLTRLERSKRLLEGKIVEQERLNKALEDFSSRAAHDLRSPLAAIQMAAGLLSDPQLQEDQRGGMAATLGRQASKAGALIDDLLDIARASGTAQRERIEVRDLFREIQEECADVQINVGAVPDTVHADPVGLRQAFLNLVRNAGAYGKRDGVAIIDVEAHRRDGATVFSLSDRGPGLDEDQRGTIFRPFERGRNTGQAGTGLGLAIVSTVAEAHAGRAWYEDRPGGGASFMFAIADPV